MKAEPLFPWEQLNSILSEYTPYTLHFKPLQADVERLHNFLSSQLENAGKSINARTYFHHEILRQHSDSIFYSGPVRSSESIKERLNQIITLYFLFYLLHFHPPHHTQTRSFPHKRSSQHLFRSGHFCYGIELQYDHDYFPRFSLTHPTSGQDSWVTSYHFYGGTLPAIYNYHTRLTFEESIILMPIVQELLAAYHTSPIPHIIADLKSHYDISLEHYPPTP